MPLLIIKLLVLIKYFVTTGWLYSRKWEDGRQQTGYQKKKIFASVWLGMDCYLLRYREGDEIPPHTDPVEGKKHYRMNITLKRALVGGPFGGGHRIIDWGRLIVMRPDLPPEHWVGRVLKGSRYILSIGWVRNE
jgi:hypothetical protein